MADECFGGSSYPGSVRDSSSRIGAIAKEDVLYCCM